MTLNPITTLKWSAFAGAVLWGGGMIWWIGSFDLASIIIFSTDVRPTIKATVRHVLAHQDISNVNFGNFFRGRYRAARTSPG